MNLKSEKQKEDIKLSIIYFTSVSCDPDILPSNDLIFLVCVACASIKQIDSAIT